MKFNIAGLIIIYIYIWVKYLQNVFSKNNNSMNIFKVKKEINVPTFE